MKKFILTLLCYVAVIAASAQIGYQVSLLNNATGEPRANEKVNVTIKITDSKGNIVCEESKSETTNDFGVLSMSVGSDDTFSKADWSNLPFFIEASVDNRLIGKSQLLSVPVAEHAKHTGTLTKEILCAKTWRVRDAADVEDRDYTFSKDGSFQMKALFPEGSAPDDYKPSYGWYKIFGDDILCYYPTKYGHEGRLLKYFESLNYILDIRSLCVLK